MGLEMLKKAILMIRPSQPFIHQGCRIAGERGDDAIDYSRCVVSNTLPFTRKPALTKPWVA
jgi:hypothetical protein